MLILLTVRKSEIMKRAYQNIVWLNICIENYLFRKRQDDNCSAIATKKEKETSDNMGYAIRFKVQQ